MKETPIIFSTEMIRALQRGKGVTRRTRGLEEINKEPDRWTYTGMFKPSLQDQYLHFFKRDDGKIESIKCPYGGKGDVLRVKETFGLSEGFANINNVLHPEVSYRAKDYDWIPDNYKWKSAMFMPKWASRYFLSLIADPIPERVQSITYDDILNEGWDVQTSKPFTNRTAGEDARDWYIAYVCCSSSTRVIPKTKARKAQRRVLTKISNIVWLQEVGHG